MRDALMTFVVLASILFGGRYLVGRRFFSSARMHVPLADGSFTLKPPRTSAILLGFIALVPAGILGLLAFQAWRSGGKGLLVAVVATALAAAAPAYLFAAAIRSRVVVRETGMERVGVLGRRLVGWTAVAKIAFNPTQRWFFLTLSDRSHLWVRADIAGVGDFAAVALRRLQPAVLEAADPIVREILQELAEAARRETPPG